MSVPMLLYRRTRYSETIAGLQLQLRRSVVDHPYVSLVPAPVLARCGSRAGLRFGELRGLRVADLLDVPYPAFRVSRSVPASGSRQAHR
jgi:hypothetical protein